jgi:hypothetical protein
MYYKIFLFENGSFAVKMCWKNRFLCKVVIFHAFKLWKRVPDAFMDFCVLIFRDEKGKSLNIAKNLDL